MATHGHGNHWDCLGNPSEMIPEILPKILQEGDTVEKGVETFIDYFEDEKPDTHTVFSISINAELSAMTVCVANETKQESRFISAYPFVQSKNQIKLKITEVDEWSNLVEGVISGETEDGKMISFFDTKYFKNKEKYKIDNYYTFAIAALGYNIKLLKDPSFSFEGQQAVDWLAKIGKEPTYDNNGNIEPIVFNLSTFVSFLPREEFPDDVEFQSPINSIETIKAFDNEFYKINIAIFRNSEDDTCTYIDLYAKTSFFEQKPEINDSIRGVMWLQGYLVEEDNKISYSLIDSDGEPTIINKYK